MEAQELTRSATRYALRIVAAATLVAVPAVATGQNTGPLDLSGTMRVRLEGIANQPRAGFNEDDALLNLRTTLRAEYDAKAVTLVAELWDSRVYGVRDGSPVSTGEVNAIELVQGYVATRQRFGRTSVAATAGRFTLNIGSRRLVAADDYRNTTNGYTGLRFDVSRQGGPEATLIYVLPQQRRPDDRAALVRNAVAPDREGFDLVLWGGTAAYPHAVGPLALELSFYHLGERDLPERPTRDRRLDTYGGRITREPAEGKADVEIEGFHQSGAISGSALPSAATLPVSAWFIHADTGYSFAGGWQPRVSIEYDRASGDRPGGAYGRFDTLFGMRRADLAPSGLYNALARTNIEALGLRLEVAPSKRIDAFASYHALGLADSRDSFASTGVRDATGQAGSFAGHQFDARVRWWVVPQALRFEADAVILTKGRFLRDAPNGASGGTTAYGSLNLTANF